ncbi:MULTISPECIES: hypothetical protein [Enterobacteriaceae]|uniref:Uncharacterized protein n=1 Tax=Klebsiella variicola TaxID=244366 RepID=A0A7H4M7I6_KLEVA|nr:MULTISPECIES: hypothetical protein [Klebsiella]MBG2721347.1 hypothetical protein [Klebsiella michiganensis]HBL0709205.1 hypothetical protein [Klebsiella oxytoca]HBW1582073.1 hypothetical protein [Klebsiella quasipneumoniae subsp. quasipneumoniae]HBZ8693478.1 hypothetical protein [Citrobacter freundii]HCB3726698.1 hypothetical protein [Escherichia coli]HEP0957716.1 hypothetical protein [Klebsiella pneumoniae subsp. ozaenae]
MQPWLKKMLTTCGVPTDGAKHVRRKIGGRFCLGAVFFVIPAMLLDLPLWGVLLTQILYGLSMYIGISLAFDKKK